MNTNVALDISPSLAYVYHESDMPRNDPVVIFCADPQGMKLYEYCIAHDIVVDGFVDTERSALDNGAPVFRPINLHLLDASKTNLLISKRGYEEFLPAFEAAGFKGVYVAHPFALWLVAVTKTDHKLKAGQIYDEMITSAPNPQHDIDIFAGDWLSEIPLPNVKSGWNRLFEGDGRVAWANEALGGFNGKNILELGPYEGGHTYALEKTYGATSVTAIESNPRAFLRCLIVKNLFDLKVSRFLLGNFMEYFKQEERQYDVIFASGVLYHMTNPAELLTEISKKTNQIFLWTHFYDEALIKGNREINFRFDYSRTRQNKLGSYSFSEYCFVYRDEDTTAAHLGGTENHAYWLKMEDIVGLLKELGFTDVQTGLVDREQRFGPNLCIAAKK
ncbi:MAG: class I SAM-dependent methyltransferase [Alphaproteobacteria bacterium]|nr:class I SAM-dependent methyltransferase [Alphaproteobacteria bacterium]